MLRGSLQAQAIAVKFGVEIMTICGGVLASSAAFNTEDDAHMRGMFYPPYNVPGFNHTQHRRLGIHKQATGGYWQEAMASGDKLMQMAVRALAQLLHKGLSDKLAAAQPQVCCP